MKHYVAICTKNREEDVSKLLESISKSQLPTQISIHIADSTYPQERFEKSRDFYQKNYADLEILHFYHEGGLPSARNACLERISDQGVIHFFDDDVEIALNYFQVVDHFFRNNLEAVGCGPRIRGLYSGKREKSRFSQIQGKLLSNGRNLWVIDELRNNLEVDWLPGCAMSFQLGALTNMRFNASLEKGPGKNYALGEDLEFTHRLAAKGKLFALAETFVDHNYAASKRDDLRLMSYASGKFMVQLKKQFPKEISIPRVFIRKSGEIVRQNIGKGNFHSINAALCIGLFTKGILQETLRPVFEPRSGIR